ncbi:MAG: hypothetical protein HGA31_06960 [Candidatus Moranbacteria bacterium]|nr:hypothetical protein [Candidatus Moranbacteria bacterium]
MAEETSRELLERQSAHLMSYIRCDAMRQERFYKSTGIVFLVASLLCLPAYRLFTGGWTMEFEILLPVGVLFSYWPSALA